MPPLRSFQDLARAGSNPLTPERSIDGQRIASWISEAKLKIQDAKRIENATSTRMDSAYDAMLFAALAIAACEKYKVTGGEGHHGVALEGAARAVGYTQFKLDEMSALKDWRNSKYTAGFTAKESDISDAIKTADLFLETSINWIEDKHPNIFSQ